MGDQKGSQKKRKTLSVFDAIQDLEVEDIHAETKRRRKSVAQVHRSKAAQSQTKIYNHLVECRILLQRAVLASLPSSTDDNSKNSTTDDGDDEEEVVDRCNGLLQSLLRARKQLLTGGDSDEEDDNGEGNEYAELVTGPTSKLQGTLQQEYETCRNEWKQVLDRRYKDLKLHAGLTAKSQFRVLDSSFWQQVDATVEYETLRKQNQGTDNEKAKNRIDELDDSKVYQQLLKDFVAHSAVMTEGKAGMSRVGTSKSSSSSKRKQVDRRASKGRKIRYKEIPKLVNFTFPLSRPHTTNLDQDEWFQSLFGGVGKV